MEKKRAQFDWLRYAQDDWKVMIPCPRCHVPAETQCDGGIAHWERAAAIVKAAKIAMFTEEWG